MNLDEIYISYYSGDITMSQAKGNVSLQDFIQAHLNPSKRTKGIIDGVRSATSKEEKSSYKIQLPCFTPSVIIPKGYARKYKNIKSFTGLIQLDFDGLDIYEAADLKEYVFSGNKEVICAYTSPSNKGVKALIRIPIVKSIEEYKEYFAGIEEEFNWIDSFDPAPKNAVLPLFLSYDTAILWRDDARFWRKKGTLPDVDSYVNLSSKPNIDFKDGDDTIYKSKAYYRRITLDIFTDRLNAIVDTGHPLMRSACLVLGSRIGAGYLDKADAEAYAEQVIRTHPYLNKGIENYLKTMRWAINQGINNPKYYE